jgi:hypothetical protein
LRITSANFGFLFFIVARGLPEPDKLCATSE